MREYQGEIKLRKGWICKIECEKCGKTVELIESQVTACKGCGEVYSAFVEVDAYSEED